MPSQLQTLGSASRSVKTNNYGLQLDPPACEISSQMTEAFDTIYRTGKWANGMPLQEPPYYYSYGNVTSMLRLSSSGVGSNIGKQTVDSLRLISETIREYKVRSMLDLPCGDVNWQFQSWEIDSLEAYVGGDVSRLVIEHDRRKFAHHHNKRFLVWDLSRCPIPQVLNISTGKFRPFDLVHMRDVIQHISIDEGVRVVAEMRRSGIKFLITTHYDVAENNGGIRNGGFYRNNMEKPPFSLGKPLRCDHARSVKHQCLFKL